MVGGVSVVRGGQGGLGCLVVGDLVSILLLLSIFLPAPDGLKVPKAAVGAAAEEG